MASKTEHRRGWQCRSHASILYGQQVCAGHKILIHVSPWSLNKDPRPQSIGICDRESAVSLRLNVSLYSQYQRVLQNAELYEASLKCVFHCNGNNPVISYDNIKIYHSFIVSQHLSRIKFLTRKIKEYYPHQSADSKVLRSARRCMCRPAIIASH